MELCFSSGRIHNSMRRAINLVTVERRVFERMLTAKKRETAHVTSFSDLFYLFALFFSH